MHFTLEVAEMEDRHHLTFETYEEGRLTLEEYLGWVVFYHRRPFTGRSFGVSCSRNRNLTPK